MIQESQLEILLVEDNPGDARLLQGLLDCAASHIQFSLTHVETIEQRVAERTAVAERRANQLRALASQLSQAEQRERRRLARAPM